MSHTTPMSLNKPGVAPKATIWFERTPKDRMRWTTTLRSIHRNVTNEIAESLNDRSLGSKPPSAIYQSTFGNKNQKSEECATELEQLIAERRSNNAAQFGSYARHNIAMGFSTTIRVRTAAQTYVPKPSEDDPNPKPKKISGGDEHKKKLPYFSFFFAPREGVLNDEFFQDTDVWKTIMLPSDMMAYADVFTIRYLQGCDLDFFASAVLGTMRQVIMVPNSATVLKVWEQTDAYAAEVLDKNRITPEIKNDMAPDELDLNFRKMRMDMPKDAPKPVVLVDPAKMEDEEMVEVPIYESEDKHKIPKRLYDKLKAAADEEIE